MYYGSMRACVVVCMYGGTHAWWYACTHARMYSRHAGIVERWLLNLLVEEIFFMIYSILYARMRGGMYASRSRLASYHGARKQWDADSEQ